MDLGITTGGVVLSGDGMGDSLGIVLVFIISGSVRRRRFSGFHPLSLMAFIFVLFRPKDFGHMILTKGNMSPFSMSESNPIRVLNNTNLLFSLTHSTFQHPFFWNHPLAICVFH